MTTKADFSEEDWARVVRAPFVAGMAITLADPGGPIEAAKESMASIKAATNPPSREQLLSEIALDIQAQVQQHHNPVKGYRPTGGTPPGEQVLQELSDVCAIVNAARDTGGGGRLRRLAGQHRRGRCRRGQGGRLHGLRGRAGQRTRDGDDREGPRSSGLASAAVLGLALPPTEHAA